VRTSNCHSRGGRTALSPAGPARRCQTGPVAGTPTHQCNQAETTRPAKGIQSSYICCVDEIRDGALHGDARATRAACNHPNLTLRCGRSGGVDALHEVRDVAVRWVRVIKWKGESSAACRETRGLEARKQFQSRCQVTHVRPRTQTHNQRNHLSTPGLTHTASRTGKHSPRDWCTRSKSATTVAPQSDRTQLRPTQGSSTQLRGRISWNATEQCTWAQTT
jgi:hypothetical protein